ncbi:MAG: Rv2231c family pyridoxal phosphate-dependent protein CobC [Nocardioidaceae bacterium]|nr:Rv2231c family pyridoxal phosphate-dependent protein CobC [Nocardioidaceae bacterium]
MDDPLRHHGDREVHGMLDFAVNVYDAPRPPWLDAALRASLDEIGTYPDPRDARATVAAHHGRAEGDVLITAGAAEAFTLIAHLRRWRCPVVVHPQFTEPHAALKKTGHRVRPVVLAEPFTLDPGSVPTDADLVMIGNPTNPTGVLHPAASIRSLLRPGRVVVVDEAFMDCVPDETQTLSASGDPGLVVVRSLTKHWGIPGIRAGYLLGEPALVRELAREQTPWSVGTTAAAALVACCSPEATVEAARRTLQINGWRAHLEQGLASLDIPYYSSAASFVLARPGAGVREGLRARGVAVRRADTFPGLDEQWVRIAVRAPEPTDRLLALLALGID